MAYHMEFLRHGSVLRHVHVIYQVIDSNGRDNVHGTISSLLGFQVPPLASAKPEQQPTLQPTQRRAAPSAPVRPRWHHTLLRTDDDLKIATPIPCVFDTQAAAAKAASEASQSQTRRQARQTGAVALRSRR